MPEKKKKAVEPKEFVRECIYCGAKLTEVAQRPVFVGEKAVEHTSITYYCESCGFTVTFWIKKGK